MSAKVAEEIEPALEGASPTLGSPRKKRRSWKKRLLWTTLVGGPLLVGVLWMLVHRIPWMGPLVANGMRSVIGKDNVAKLEDFVYSIEDRVNRTVKADEAPKAHWSVPAPSPPAPIPVVAPTEPTGKDQPAKAPFAPSAPGAMYPGFSAPGDGTWVPLTDPRRPGEAPRMFKTLIHPDKSRGWAELFVVAVDLRTVELLMMAGYQEPRTEKKEAEGYARKSKIPSDHWAALLGAFNGGFMAEHGHYGFALDGITFIDPKPESCTLARFSDGSYDIAPWERLAPRQPEMTWFRQAPSCMYDDGKMHPSLAGAHQRKWGATLDGNTVIRRSAIGMSTDHQILYVGITNHTTAKVLAQGMHHVGAQTVAQMDVNWSYPKFVTYAPDKQGQLRPIALADGFEFSDNLYVRERSMRDFFYLARKEEVVSQEAANVDAKAPGTAPPTTPVVPQTP